MGLIEIASGNSVWRGMDYYNSKKVESVEKNSGTTYDGTVRGTELYHVHIDLEHPRKSSCTCPFDDGRRVICKHMIALIQERWKNSKTAVAFAIALELSMDETTDLLQRAGIALSPQQQV